MDVSSEIKYQTTRSGGKGGQNVNKVETAVIGSFNVDASTILSDPQKLLVHQKLSNRINKDGWLVVKSQTFRSQLENKVETTRRMNELVRHALIKKKMRIATKPSRNAKEKRLDAKKRSATIKEGRRKFKF